MTNIGMEQSKIYKSSKQRNDDYLAEFNNKEILKNLINNETPVIVDVGANYGQSAISLLEVFPKATIHCVEPLPFVFSELKKHAPDNVICHNYAFGSHNETEKMHVNKHQHMLSSLYKLNENSKDSIAINQPEPSHDNFLDSEEITVQCQTLDYWAEENKINNIDLLKMDAQGAEPMILEQGTEILKNTKVIITELMFYDLYERSNSFYDIEKTLIPLGFKLFDIGYISKNPMNGRTDWVDVIYVRN